MTIEDIVIRSERSGDEEAIDLVNCRAFGAMGEPNVVRLLRTYYPAFDTRYSITAWEAGRMVGHTLCSPADIRLRGETVRALVVAPVAVMPERQRVGIGAKMLAYGHELGARDGFTVAFLAGHPDYYPRHGYVPCYGFAGVTIDRDKLPKPSQKLDPWPVRDSDVPWLVERFAAEWNDVDFAWLWGANFAEWTLPCTHSLVWRTRDGRRAAYTLENRGGNGWKMVLAETPDLARDVLATIRPEALEQHPNGWLARNALDPTWSTAESKVHPAAMARELQAGALKGYAAELEAGSVVPGSCPWPLPFVVC